MKSEKMNDSMVSNDATEERGDYYRREANIIQQNYLTTNIQQHNHSSTN